MPEIPVNKNIDEVELSKPGKPKELRKANTKNDTMSFLKVLRKALSFEGVRDFFKFRDKDGNFSWEQVGISMLQIVLFVAIAYVSSLLGIPIDNLLAIF